MSTTEFKRTALQQVQLDAMQEEQRAIRALLPVVEKFWQRTVAPSTALRQMAAVRRLLQRYAGRR